MSCFSFSIFSSSMVCCIDFFHKARSSSPLRILPAFWVSASDFSNRPKRNSALIYFRTISSYPIIIDLWLRTRLLILKKSLWKIFCILSEKCCLICLLQYYHMWSKHYLRILYLTQWEVCLWLGLGWPLCWRWPVSMTHAWWSGVCHPPRVGGWGRHSVVAWTDCPGNHHTLTAGTYNMR